MLGALLASFFAATANPVYVSQTQILIDPKLPQFLLQQPQSEINLSIDTAQIESQLAVLRSRKIATIVIDKLDLTHNPKFLAFSRFSFAERLRRLQAIFARWGLNVDLVPSFLTKSKPAPSPLTAKQRAIEAFTNSLNVQRVGVSYAIDIQFRSVDPDLSAKIANATSEAYVNEQIENRSSDTQEGMKWLEQRIQTVAEQMNAATRLVAESRARHDYSVQDPPMVTPPSGIGIGADAGKKMPLNQLEVNASTYRKLYESLLSAYSDSVGRQSGYYNNARVISTAVGAEQPSGPRSKLIVAFGLLAGLTLGTGLSVARYSLDRTVRSARQVREELETPCIAELPVVSFRRGGFGRLDEILKDPYSLYAQHLRGVKLALDLSDTSQRRVIGVTCVSPGDGKGTVVSNLAALYSTSGVKTLVVCADDKSPIASLLPKPAAKSTGGIPPAEGETTEDETEKPAERLGLPFDIVGSTPSLGDSKLLQENLKEVLKETKNYKTVIVDLPPFSFGPDSLIVTPALDSVLVVADHKRTSLDELGDLLQALRDLKANLAGVVLARVRSVSGRRHRKLTGQSPR